MIGLRRSTSESFYIQEEVLKRQLNMLIIK